MPKIQPLFSGSSGNAILVEGRGSALLVDAGVSGKRIVTALEENRKAPSMIDGILITHEHIDHIQSAGILSRRYHIPIYANAATWEAMLPTVGEIAPSLCRTLEPGEEIVFGDIAVSAFPIPHDAASPVGYNFFTENKKLTVATDIGKMSDKIFMRLSGANRYCWNPTMIL